jgi:hypothetical protein
MATRKAITAVVLLWLGVGAAATVQAQATAASTTASEAQEEVPELAAPTEGVVRPGGTEVRIPLPASYRSVRDNAPRIGALLEASLPQQMHFLDAFYSRADLTAAILGTRPPDDIVMLVATLRDAEAMTLDTAAWEEAKPLMARGVAGADLDTMMESMREGTNSRLSATVGAKVDMALRTVGRTQVYDTSGDAIRFQVRMKVKGQVAGKESVRDLVMAAAIARLRGKLIYLYLYDAYEGDASAPALREALEQHLGKIYAANASPEAAAEAPSPAAAGD